MAPALGATAYYQLSEYARLGLDYLYSSYNLEQRFSSASLDAQGRVHLYGDQRVKWHRAGVKAELSLLRYIEPTLPCTKWLNLYLGTGLGVYTAYGSEYSIDATESGKVIVDGKEYPLTDDLTFTDVKQLVIQSKGSLSSTNKSLNTTKLYVPLSLSVEADIDPHFTVGVKGEFDFIVNKNWCTPDYVAPVLATLNYKF